MPRNQNPVDPRDGPLAAFAHDLRVLREKAGNPPYRVLAKRAGFSASTLSVAASGTVLPSLDVTLAYAETCGGDPERWRERWTELADLLRQPPPGPEVSAPTTVDTEVSGSVANPEPDGPEPHRAFPPRLRLRSRMTRTCLAAAFLVVGVTAGVFVDRQGHQAPTTQATPTTHARYSPPTTRVLFEGGGPFAYDETIGPGCVMVFAPGHQEQIAQVEPDNSVDMAHAWVAGTSDEPHWAIPNCSNAVLDSQPSTEANRYQWQNDYVWKFFDVPPGVPCTFHIYIADSPLSKYDATYDWTNGLMVGDWVDANAFTVDQAAHVGSWYGDSPHTYTSGMAFLMLTDQRGDNPPSADAPLTASEVRLTCVT